MFINVWERVAINWVNVTIMWLRTKIVALRYALGLGLANGYKAP